MRFADRHAARHEILTQPVTTSTRSESIPELFAAQVARTPEAVAVSSNGGSMTYRELDEGANRLGHLLAGHGVCAHIINVFTFTQVNSVASTDYIHRVFTGVADSTGESHTAR